VKDRSLEELDEIFAARTPALRFENYTCHKIDEAMSCREEVELKDASQHVEEVVP